MKEIKLALDLEGMGKSRKFRNFFIYPVFLLKCGFIFSLVGVNLLLLSLTILEKWDSYWIRLPLISVASIVAAMICVYFIHKVTGPMVAIVRTCHEFSSGNKAVRVRLRPGDEFLEVAEAINKMMDRCAAAHEH